LTNIPLHIFGVNATLDGVAENDEENPGGFIADRTARTNAPRTALTLEAYGPAASPGNMDLIWDSSRIHIYAAATGGSPLSQYSVPFASFIGTTLYVEGIAPGSNVLQWTYSEQTNCVDQILVTVLKVEIEEIGFTGDHLIKEWPSGPAIDYPDGTSPIWKKIGNPDKPVTYTKGAQPTAFAKVSVFPGNLETTLTTDFRIKANGIVVAEKSGVQLNGSEVSLDNISFSSSLVSTVKKSELLFEWEMKLAGEESWSSIGTSGPHTFYWSYATPLESPLYDFALEKVCTYADGQTNASESSAELRSGIYSELGSRYSPTGTWKSASAVLEVYGEGYSLICSTYANLTAYLNRSLGIPASVVHIWAGTAEQGYIWWYAVDDPPYPGGTILVDPGSWLWLWHAVADTAEGYSDSALGVQGVAIVHKHTNATVQYKNVGNTMTGQESYEVGYINPDPLNPHIWP
jgi:hypothetical protein